MGFASRVKNLFSRKKKPDPSSTQTPAPTGSPTLPEPQQTTDTSTATSSTTAPESTTDTSSATGSATTTDESTPKDSATKESAAKTTKEITQESTKKAAPQDAVDKSVAAQSGTEAEKAEAKPDPDPTRPLEPFEKKLLAKKKKSLFHMIVKKTNTLDAPGRMAAQKTTKEKVESAASNVYELVSECGGVLTDSLDIASEVADSVKSLPVIGAVIKAVKTTISIGGYMKDLVGYIKDVKKGGGVTTGEEIMEQVSGGLEQIVSAADAVMSVLGIFQNIPVVGGLIGLAASAISFASNFKTLIQSKSRLIKIRHLKEKAKHNIAQQQGGDEFVKEDQKKHVRKFTGKDMGKVRDAKTGKMRKRRLDEYTEDMAALEANKNMAMGQSKTPEQEQELLSMGQARRNLEDYDVAKELTGANKKRGVSAISNIVGDAIGFVGGLTQLIPSGAGNAVATGISAAFAVAGIGKTAIKAARQVGRNQGLAGFSANKSTSNKKTRRHRLALIAYGRIKCLNKLGLETMEPEEADPQRRANIRGTLSVYEKYNAWVGAMGVSKGALYRAETSDEMVEIMRNGFYREKG